MSKKKYIRLFVIALLLFAPYTTFAENTEQQDIYTVPKLVAVQNRKYNVNQNVSALLGYLPADAFTKGLTVGAAYTYYFSDFTAWEVLNANYVFNLDTKLKNDLANNFSAQAENDRMLDFPQYYGTTSLIYTPLYNKNLLFNKAIVYGENSFVVGAGAAKFKLAGFLPMIGGGIILKYFMGKSTSLKLDIREWVYNDDIRGVNGILDIKLGFDMLLGETPRDNL